MTSDEDFEKMASVDHEFDRTRENAAYNRSLRDVYTDMLMERMSKTHSMANEDEDSNGINEEFEIGMMEDEDGDSDFYRKFKKSILNETDLDKNMNAQVEEAETYSDAWLDENSTLDQDYSSEADKSFYDDNQDEEVSTDDEDDFEDDDDVESYISEELGDNNSQKIIAYFVLLLFGVLVIGQIFRTVVPLFSPSQTVMNTSGMPALQKQINHLYSEIDHREQRSKSDFEKTIQVVINQFEKKIKELLPSNVAAVKKQLDLLTNKVNQLSMSLSRWEKSTNPLFTMDNVTEWQNSLTKELESQLPQEIPVIMNNDSTIMVIPEMNQYLQNLIVSLIKHTKLDAENSTLQYDLNQYVREILANDFHYVDKEYFIKELNRNLQINKGEIWQEMSASLNQWRKEQRSKNSNTETQLQEQCSTIFLRKMVNNIYNTNKHQWEDDLDFATFAQGTKLLNHLTSTTWNQGTVISPLDILQDANHGPSTYWQCGEPQQCTWAIRFKDPVYLTRLSYLHGRFNNNLHAMNSAPKLISVYIKLARPNKDLDVQKLISLAQKFNQGQTLKQDRHYIRIGQYSYNLADPRIRQPLPLPSWFIQLKPLVRSIVFEVNENYGNRKYTSLRKYVINAVTQEDLMIMESNSFPLRLSDTPQYADPPISTLVDHFNQPHRVADHLHEPNNYKHLQDEEDVPAFGQDEPIP